MSADTECGLAVKQLLKMLAHGDITNTQFKQLAANVVGFDEEVPIKCGSSDEEDEVQQQTAAPSAPAAVAANPTATEAGGDQSDEKDGEQVCHPRRPSRPCPQCTHVVCRMAPQMLQPRREGRGRHGEWVCANLEYLVLGHFERKQGDTKGTHTMLWLAIADFDKLGRVQRGGRR